MSSYNLKAKNKKTGEIVEIVEIDGLFYEKSTLYDVNKGIVYNEEFNELYEVIIMV